MPLTYPKEDGTTLHLWLTKTVEDNPRAELKALCGGVHVFAGKDDLVTLEEMAESMDRVDEGEYEDMVDLLDRGPVCNQCGDRIRERLGLEERSLTDVPGIGPTKMVPLKQAGFESIKDLHLATQSDLSDVEGIGNALAARIKADVGSPPGERR